MKPQLISSVNSSDNSSDQQSDSVFTEQNSQLEIPGINQPIIIKYFQTLNNHQFAQTAALFDENGVMHPPFTKPILGTDAIADYLHQEARGIKAFPHQGIQEFHDCDRLTIEIQGRAETSWCGVNVMWQFSLNPYIDKITYMRLKLLASPQELLQIKPI